MFLVGLKIEGDDSCHEVNIERRFKKCNFISLNDFATPWILLNFIIVVPLRTYSSSCLLSVPKNTTHVLFISQKLLWLELISLNPKAAFIAWNFQVD